MAYCLYRNNAVESRHHFRYGTFNPNKRQCPKKHLFGTLRVLNDDIVSPGKGFGTHEHRNVEIFTYVLNGKLSHHHIDSEGKEFDEALPRGSVQYMSAGEFVEHSEMNLDNDNICRFLQTWIKPIRDGLKPQYGSFDIDYNDRHNKLLHIISGINSDKLSKSGIKLMQDINVYVSELDKNKQVELLLNQGRIAYLLCAEGKVNVNSGDFELDTRGAVRLFGKKCIKIEAIGEEDKIDNSTDMKMPSAHIMIVEMNQDENKKTDVWDGKPELNANVRHNHPRGKAKGKDKGKGKNKAKEKGKDSDKDKSNEKEKEKENGKATETESLKNDGKNENETTNAS